MPNFKAKNSKKGDRFDVYFPAFFKCSLMKLNLFLAFSSYLYVILVNKY